MTPTTVPIEVLDVVRSAVAARFPSMSSKVAFTYLSGSVTEGLATPKSDFDAYVVLTTDDKDEEAEVFVPTHLGMVEITTLNMSTVDQVASKLRLGYHKTGGLSSYELHLAHRLLSGVALDKLPNFQRAQNEINHETLTSYLRDFSHSFAEKCFSDGIGNLAAGDEDSALFNADRALHLSLDYLLAIKGNTSSLIKWRSRYAKKFLGQTHPVYVRYMDIVGSVPAHGEHNKREFIARVGRFMQAIWDYGHAQQHIPTMNFQLTNSRLCGPDPMANDMSAIRKVPWARIVNFEGKLYLTGHSTMFEITRDVLAVWLTIDNASNTEQVVDAICHADLRQLGIAAEYVTQCLRKFQDCGVVY